MKFAAKSLCLMFLCAAGIAQTVTPSFPTALKNVIVIVQENRTPDNLFHFITPLCTQNTTTCRPSPVTTSCYDVSNCGLSNQSGTDVAITLTGVPLSGSADPSHSHTAFVDMCDADSSGNCRNDGAWRILPSDGSYTFVQNPVVTNYDGSTGHLLDPYLTFAETYGWANFMYQTNQGPSSPAHQFLFGGTPAPSAASDAQAIFASDNIDNTNGNNKNVGCIAPAGSTVAIIGASAPLAPMHPCFEHSTLPDVMLSFTGVITHRAQARFGRCPAPFSTFGNRRGRGILAKHADIHTVGRLGRLVRP